MFKQSSRLKSLSLFAAAMTAAALILSGCGGGSDGAAGAPGEPGAPGAAGAPGSNLVAKVDVGSNSAAPSATSTAAWAALSPKIQVTSVTIASPPVVKFTVKDADGKPVVGLNNKSQSTSTVAALTNVAFTLAKLVPGANNEPSKWVSYNVLRVPTIAEKAGTIAATTSCDSVTTPTWCGTYPATDAQGTLVDNGDGSYQYTFLRDPKQAKALAASLIDTANGLNKKADLGDLTFDATLTHRLGIQIGGNAPGTGNNTPTAATLTPAVAIGHAANAVFDFRPDGAAVTDTRNVVKLDSCSNCHDGKVLAHGSRLDPEYCMTCHTDQIKYSFSQEATTTSTYVLNGKTGATTSVVDGRAVGNFPNFMHKLHMGSKLVKTGYSYLGRTGAMAFNSVTYPQSVTNCVKCHDGSATAVNKTANGDNWKSVPSILACGSCHDGINFATGTGVTLTDKAKDLAAKVAVGTTQTGHIGGAKSNNTTCVLCHDAGANEVIHRTKMPTTADAAKRTMSATISGVTVDANGGVTAKFSVTDAGVAVTDPTKFTMPEMMLAKLVPGANGAASHWVSYTSRYRTKDATMEPVLQGYSENTSDGTQGTLTANVDGSFSYKFALVGGSTPGDIRTITTAPNKTATSITGIYSRTSWVSGPNVVAYEPALTHRVAMIFQKVGTTNVDNATNAFKDFVPVPVAGTTAATRNIVSMDNCATCHSGVKLHKGYKTELCVTCHNPSTQDPLTAGNPTVDLQRVVHKLHMGVDLASKSYTINGETYAGGYPGIIKDCAVCHKEGSGSPANAANWRTVPTQAACSTCHESTVAVAHITQNVVGGVDTCVTCHGTGRISDVAVVHAVIK